jgi:hypothetical protein
MESIGKIVKVSVFAKAASDKNGKSKGTKIAVNKHLHSPAHLLADELCLKLHDKKHFGFYLKMATLYNHDWLRKLCAEVLEKKDVQTPGKLFAYLIKKNNDQVKSEAQNPSEAD